MKILLLGASGFVGYQLTQQLQKDPSNIILGTYNQHKPGQVLLIKKELSLSELIRGFLC